MLKNESKKAYMFYVSDYHFEMIGLLNIKKELKENKKIIIFTQNNLEETIKTVLSKINIVEKEKKEIEKIDWTENSEVKYEYLQKAIEKEEKVSIYIKGEEKYIEEQNKKIAKITKGKENVWITDCYDFNEIANKSKEITKKYQERIVTKK